MQTLMILAAIYAVALAMTAFFCATGVLSRARAPRNRRTHRLAAALRRSTSWDV